jgi:hypothetical protein
VLAAEQECESIFRLEEIRTIGLTFLATTSDLCTQLAHKPAPGLFPDGFAVKPNGFVHAVVTVIQTKISLRRGNRMAVVGRFDCGSPDA